MVEALHELHAAVSNTGNRPVVIDSDDLAVRPAATMGAYCASVGSPFIFQALTWEPGERPEWQRSARWHMPFVAGEPTSSLARAAAVADMISSAGSVMDFEKYLSVNPDLSIHFHRIPVGDWLGHTSLVRVSADGYGQSDAQPFDSNGAIGQSLKSLLVAPC